jgi:type IV secretory pathway TraG/TraD family ATPase VirD4
MLTQLFLAARKEKAPPLPYVRQIIRSGLPAAAERLNTISPQLATQFLDVNFADANLLDRFLLSAWGTLTARMRPLLTETVIRSFAVSDVTPAQLMQGNKPVSIYLRWPERDLLALSPLIRLVWGSFIDELITTYDQAEGRGCKPVLLVVDKAGRTAIPTLAEHATTVVGRGISLWLAIQSLSQLEAVYGKVRAQILRDNMESQLYYRPTDLATAKYLEERLGSQSAYAHSTTLREGEETSQGLAERPVPLLAAQEILQLKDDDVIGFHRNLPPFQMKRIDWRQYPIWKQRRSIPPPPLQELPELAEITMGESNKSFPDAYIDPDTRG